MECTVCFHLKLEAGMWENYSQDPCAWQCGYIPSLFSKQIFFLMQVMLQLALRTASVHGIEIQSNIKVPFWVSRFPRTAVKLRFLGREHSQWHWDNITFLAAWGAGQLEKSEFCSQRASVGQLVLIAISSLAGYVWALVLSVGFSLKPLPHPHLLAHCTPSPN